MVIENQKIDKKAAAAARVERVGDTDNTIEDTFTITEPEEDEEG